MSGTDFPDVDLFGEAVQPRQEGRGRPEHVPTVEKLNRVLMAFISGRNLKEAATVIGVSVPTLRKHYFSAVAQRSAAALKFEIQQLIRLNASAQAGSVAAEKELARRLEKARLDELANQVSRNARPPAPERVGKKVAAQQAAEEISGLYETPPPPPSLLN